MEFRKCLLSVAFILVCASGALVALGDPPPPASTKTDCPQGCAGLKLESPYCDTHAVCQSGTVYIPPEPPED